MQTAELYYIIHMYLFCELLYYKQFIKISKESHWRHMAKCNGLPLFLDSLNRVVLVLFPQKIISFWQIFQTVILFVHRNMTNKSSQLISIIIRVPICTTNSTFPIQTFYIVSEHLFFHKEFNLIFSIYIFIGAEKSYSKCAGKEGGGHTMTIFNSKSGKNGRRTLTIIAIKVIVANLNRSMQ